MCTYMVYVRSVTTVRRENMFDQTARDYMVVGSGVAGVGTTTMVAVAASGVQLSTPMVVTTTVIGSAPVTSTIALATGWGVLFALGKGAATVGAGMFIYGFGRGVARGISAYRAEKRAVKAEQESKH